MTSQPGPSTAPASPLYDLAALGEKWSIQSTSSGKRHAVFQDEIRKSLNDKRSYRLIRLENGLEALLVSDPTLDKAAASLSVGIGHLSDPDDLPGLAHFCEHSRPVYLSRLTKLISLWKCCFSERRRSAHSLLALWRSTWLCHQFPDEAEYKRYLSAHSGTSNAYTSADETNYYFNVQPSALAGALERHSQFFVAPLFLESCTEREVNAVDSEFRRNLQLDNRRLHMLGKATSSRDAGAVYWKFGTGSKDTLWEEPRKLGVDVRERLLEWYRQYYSASLMKFAIVSTQTLDELTELASSLYSSVPNLGTDRPIFETPLLSDNQFKSFISYRTIKDSPQLRIDFPLPDSRHLWRSKPARYVCGCLGHEGKGSILAELKDRGWATYLSCGASNGAPGFDYLEVDISLTALGYEHHTEVLALVFQYLDLLRTEGPQRRIFDESKALDEVSWRWREHGQPIDTATSLSTRLHSPYLRDYILAGPAVALDYDDKAIRDILGLLQPERCRVFLGNKDPLPGREWAQKEQYYSTEHSIGSLPSTEALKAPSLALPPVNRYVPTALELVASDGKKAIAWTPTLIHQTSSSTLFFKKDDTWNVPRSRAHFLLRSPAADASPRDAIKTQVFAELVEAALAEDSYLAALAGLHYSVGSDSDGLEFSVRGYSEKLPVLLASVLDTVRNLPPNSTHFAATVDRLKRAYANAALSNPSAIVANRVSHMTLQTWWTWDERLAALQDLQLEEVLTHATPLLHNVHVIGLVHGNATRKDALSIHDLVQKKLQLNTTESAAHDFHRALFLPQGQDTIYRPSVPSPENVNSAVEALYQIGAATDDKKICCLHLFAQIAKVPIFSTLRTKEQLGYIVQSGSRVQHGVDGFRVIVQSERSPEYVESRIDALWSTFESHISELSDEDFAKQRQSLVDQRLEKPKNLGQESSRYWDQIDNGEFDFFRRDRQAQIIATLTKQDVLDFFKTYVSPASRSRTKLSVLMRSQRLQPSTLEGLVEAVSKHGDSKQVEAFKMLVASKPTAAQLRFEIEKHFTDNYPAAIAEELEGALQIPQLPDRVVEVTDVELFRSSLEKAPKVEPRHEYESDLQSHL